MKRKERSSSIDTFIQKNINSISTVSCTPIEYMSKTNLKKYLLTK